MKKQKVIDISKKSFFSVIAILFLLMLFAIVLTYILPKGIFEKELDGTIRFDQFIPLENQKGIAIWKGLLSPLLILSSSSGLTILMLSLFIMIISGAFQIMADVNGMKIFVLHLIEKFKEKQTKLVVIIVLFFMLLGSLLGLFEETLTLLPIIVLLSLSLGYDSYTGFLMCTIATGFGFSCAISNPFSVIIASSILGVEPMKGVWLRILLFVVMYGVLLAFIFLHIRKIKKDPSKSPTYAYDSEKRKEITSYVCEDAKTDQRTFKVYCFFLLGIFITMLLATSLPMLRDYTVVCLIVVFLIGGILAGYLSCQSMKIVMKSFLRGVLAALPAIIMILMASSIKYILEEGVILDTITHSISTLVQGHNTYFIAFIILGIILILEFFISSSTAKAIFVMGILGGIPLPLSKELLVLLYLFGDGFTNVLFPTSPVLLIATSMVGISYPKWIKQSKWLFALLAILIAAFICFAIYINY